MKERIISALKTSYAHLGFGPKAFDGVAAYLEKTVTDESQLETAVAGVEALLKAFQSDADKIRTEKSALQKQFDEYRERHPAAGGGQESKIEPDKKETDADTPGWAKALIDANKSLADRIAAMEGDKVVASRKQQIDAIVDKLPEALRKPYARLAFKGLSDEDFSALKEEIGAEVEELAKTANAKGAVFRRPAASGATKATTGGVQEATDEEVQRVVDGMHV